MKSEDIREVKKSSPKTGIFTIKLNNGDYYKALRASDGARGYRWQYAYIDKNINRELLDCVVFCKFIPEHYNTDWNPNINYKDYCEWF